MSTRRFTYILALVTALSCSSAFVAGQSKSSAVPRTPEGKPDLQGVWDFRTITPMERPKALADKAVMTQEEAREWEIQNRRNQDVRENAPSRIVGGQQSTADVDRAYNDFWWDFGDNGVRTRRTSLVVDPPDGQIPPLTAEGQKRAVERRQRFEGVALGPEDRSLAERCILGLNDGPPMFPHAYNNNLQIVQTSDYVVLHSEMVHNARVVPLVDKATLRLPAWSGNSRGRWEGDTLVIETTGFLGQTSFPNSSETLHLIERFTRTDEGTLTYRFTLSDPTTWTRPWTAELPMVRSNGMMFEYACHEANYGMEGLLKGARFMEKQGTAPTQGSIR